MSGDSAGQLVLGAGSCILGPHVSLMILAGQKMLAQANPPLIDYPGPEGFLGTRASLMLDVVFLAMFVVILVLAWSIHQVRQGRFALHKRTQIILAVVLLAAVTAFEIEMRVYGWQSRAAGSLDGAPAPAVWYALYVHLVFAISSAVLWPVVIVRALRQFPNPPEPGQHSPSHRLWGRLAAADMVMTSVTGWIFYWLAFVD